MTNRDLANLTRLEAASEDLTTEERQSIAAVLAFFQKTVATCRRHNTQAVNIGAQALAAKILREAGA